MKQNFAVNFCRFCGLKMVRNMAQKVKTIEIKLAVFAIDFVIFAVNGH